MSVKIKDLFPVGTIIKVKDEEKRFMIMGILQQAKKEDIVKKFDYIAVPYPEGYLDPSSVVMLNQENIEEIVYYGFVDFERQVFMANVISKLGPDWGD